ncbi:type II secretion system F family protein [Nesterenkonia alkaliphila]|uniref:Type II secretion system protein F n=1 Tax=Nesterenkonia alkaliphila TaxID=1463631 RepID=A0A7K1UI89_9MICC|nr:type II secretion system F family protein [Nesterenkonia alkaliphila]MVT26177.1 type II secretion system protein F [Nesterenkonia alkaliphila]GFZ84255.1 type II secretion system protein F [Nesterenkonia alkaliphila]
MTGAHTAEAALLGLGLGIGLLLVLASCTPAPPKTTTTPRTSRVRRLLDEAGHHRVPVSAILLSSAGCAAATFVAVFTITTALPVAACFALFAAALPWAMLRWQLRRRRKQLGEVWPDVIDHLRSAVRSGLSLPEGLIELGHSGPAALREPFAEFGSDWRAGVPMDSALERLKLRLADPVGDRIVLALRMTRELGGTQLGRLLDTLAEVLREASRTRGELEARQSWTVTGAKLAVAAPWAVVLLLSTQPEAAVAYRSGTGTLLLVAGLGVSALSYHLMLRIGSLPAEERVLA